MTDWTGGPEREWYDEMDEDSGLESGRIPHVESFPAPEPVSRTETGR